MQRPSAALARPAAQMEDLIVCLSEACAFSFASPRVVRSARLGFALGPRALASRSVVCLAGSARCGLVARSSRPFRVFWLRARSFASPLPFVAPWRRALRPVRCALVVFEHFFFFGRAGRF